MREYLTVSDIANSVFMMRSAFKGTLLVVEGPTDHRLYGKFTDRSEVRTVIAHSKDNVKGVIREVCTKRGLKEVIGIIDSDLDLLMGNKVSPPLFRTDTRDAESMILSSGSFKEVLWEYADQDKLAHFESKYGDVVERIEDGAYPVGLMMYLSQCEDLNLSFKDLEFMEFIDRNTLRCDIGKLCSAVVRNTMSARISPRELHVLMDEYMQEKHYVDEVCRGHDLINVMAIGLKFIFGSDNALHLRAAALGSALRLTYDFRDFRTTRLYADTGAWAEKNGLRLWSS